MNTTPAPGTAPERRWAEAWDRVPAWLRSPKLLVPLAFAAMLVLLLSFASVVQDIVHQGETGNGTPSAVSPGVDRV